MEQVTYLHNFDRINELQDALFNLISENKPLPDPNRICIQGLTDNESWDNNSKTNMRKRGIRNERHYAVLHKSLVGTIFDDIVQAYPQYYRWRLLNIPTGWNYPIHNDGPGNKRIHIPVTANSDCFLCFYDKPVTNGSVNTIQNYNLEAGKVYEIDSSGWHTAVNWGEQDRWHLIGIRTEI